MREQERRLPKTMEIKDQANVSFNLAAVMSDLNMSREGLQKTRKEDPGLAQLLIDRVLPKYADTTEKQEQLKRSLYEYLGVDTMTISGQATLKTRQADQMGSLNLAEAPQATRPSQELPKFTASDALTSLLSELLGEQKGYRFKLTRPNANTVHIEVIDTKEGGIAMAKTLKRLVQQLQNDLNQNNANVALKLELPEVTLTGDRAQLDRVAQLLQQASGEQLSSTYVDAMKHTGFFRWQDREETPELATEPTANEGRSCFVQ